MQSSEGIISYNTAQLRTAADEFEKISSEVKSVAGELQDEIMPQLKSGWEGANSDQYTKKISTAASKIKKFSNDISMIQALVEISAMRAEAADRCAAAITGTIS